MRRPAGSALIRRAGRGATAQDEVRPCADVGASGILPPLPPLIPMGGDATNPMLMMYRQSDFDIMIGARRGSSWMSAWDNSRCINAPGQSAIRGRRITAISRRHGRKAATFRCSIRARRSMRRRKTFIVLRPAQA